MSRVVVVGSGWGGFKALRSLKGPGVASIVNVSIRDHFLFTPLLTSTCVGTLEFRNVAESVRRAKYHVPMSFHQAEVLSVDPELKKIRVSGVYDEDDGLGGRRRPEYDIPYDKLVLSVGAQAQTFGIEGVKEYCFKLKQIQHARKVRGRLMECFERASSPTTSEAEKRRLLSIVIIGAGPTNIEFAGELFDFLHQDVKKVYSELFPYVNVTVLEASDHVLGAFDSSLVQYTEKLLRRRGIRLVTNCKIARVSRHAIHLGDGTEMPFGLAVWNTGNAPVPLTEKLPFAKGPGGRLLVGDRLQLVDQPDIHAIGDCAAFTDSPLPPTAQAANQQGKYIGKLLSSDSDIGPFKYNHKGMMAYIGGKTALLNTDWFGLRGLSAWLVWNGAYLTDAVSFTNMILNPMQWVKSQLFGRDVLTLKSEPDTRHLSSTPGKKQ